MTLAPTHREAKASASDAVTLTVEIEAAITAYGEAAFNEGQAYGFDGSNRGDDAPALLDLRRVIAAALATPSSVQAGEVSAPASAGAVPEGWRLVPVDDDATDCADNLVALIIEKAKGYDTPSEADPRRRFTQAQIDLAIRAAYRVGFAAAPATPEPAAKTTFPQGAGTGTYFRRLPNNAWVMLNSGGQWVSIAAPTWQADPAPEPAAARRENPSLLALLERERARLFEPHESGEGYRFGDDGLLVFSLTNAEARSTLSASTADEETAGDGGREAMPNPTPEELASPQFEAIWRVIKSWDVNVPEAYVGYCGAHGGHVAVILRALAGASGAAGDGALEWAVARWHAEVENRPLQNVHRRALDTTWRQVIRRFGGDPGALVGPSHDALVDNAPPTPTRPNATAEDATPATPAEGR